LIIIRNFHYNPHFLAFIITFLPAFRRQELTISDLASTIREQDHALTTLTQEKRELQLQMRSNQQEPRRGPEPRGLRRISECTEPSRDSSMESCEVRIEEVTDDDEDEIPEESECHPVDHLSVVMEEDSIKLSPSPSGCSSEPKTSTSEEDELQVPRADFICHSPDQVFPGRKSRPARCRSLDLDGALVLAPPYFTRAISCPARLLTSSSDDDWGD
jgi:hypothetical protein